MFCCQKVVLLYYYTERRRSWIKWSLSWFSRCQKRWKATTTREKRRRYPTRKPTGTRCPSRRAINRELEQLEGGNFHETTILLCPLSVSNEARFKPRKSTNKPILSIFLSCLILADFCACMNIDLPMFAENDKGENSVGKKKLDLLKMSLWRIICLSSCHAHP